MKVIPAINLRARFGIPRMEQDVRSRLVEVRSGDRTVGLLVDSAREFADIPADAIKPLPEGIGGLSGDYLRGVAQRGERLLLLLAMLRSADALDSRSLEPARLVFALGGLKLTSARRALRVTCYLERDCPKARKVYSRRKKFRLLEELLYVRVEVDLAFADSLRMVG